MYCVFSVPFGMGLGPRYQKKERRKLHVFCLSFSNFRILRGLNSISHPSQPCPLWSGTLSATSRVRLAIRRSIRLKTPRPPPMASHNADKPHASTPLLLAVRHLPFPSVHRPRALPTPDLAPLTRRLEELVSAAAAHPLLKPLFAVHSRLSAFSQVCMNTNCLLDLHRSITIHGA
jgi:hypothetical protein